MSFFTVRHDASAIYAMVLCLPVTSRCSAKTAQWIELIFGMEAFFDLFCTGKSITVHFSLHIVYAVHKMWRKNANQYFTRVKMYLTVNNTQMRFTAVLAESV